MELAGRFEDACGGALFHTGWIAITDIDAGHRQQFGHFRCRRAAGRAGSALRSGLMVDTGRFRKSLCGRGVAVVVYYRGEIACVQ